MGVCDFCDDYDYGIKQVAGNDDYDYDEGRYLFFDSLLKGEEPPIIPAAAGSFSLDATLGLLATRRRLGRRGDSSAMRSLLWCELYVMKIIQKLVSPLSAQSPHLHPHATCHMQ